MELNGSKALHFSHMLLNMLSIRADQFELYKRTTFGLSRDAGSSRTTTLRRLVDAGSSRTTTLRRLVDAGSSRTTTLRRFVDAGSSRTTTLRRFVDVGSSRTTTLRLAGVREFKFLANFPLENLNALEILYSFDAIDQPRMCILTA